MIAAKRERTRTMVMKKRVSYFVLAFAPLWSACGGEQPLDPAPPGGAGGGQVTPVPLPTAGSSSAAGGAGAPASAAATTAGGMASSSGAPPTLGGAATSGSGGGSSGTNSTSGSGGVSNTAGAGGSTTSTGGGPVFPPGCKVSNPVSFKADIGPWLNTSCGKGKGGGCHVTDDVSTVNSGGFNHAYDWITAGSHNEFCKQTPGPIRFTVVLDVVHKANPASCTNTRVMPPDGPPLDACQMAALEAWLAEPKVLQLHRADDTSPTAPYLMPPFN